MTALASTTPSVAELLAWPDSTLARVRHLMSLRRYLTGSLYRSIRAQYEAAIGAGEPPRDMRAAAAVADRLPATRYFVWLDRHIQDETWRLAETVVDQRVAELVDCLACRQGDLGTLMELPGDAGLPEYYTGSDFHRQAGGIWRDERGAAIYAVGARIVHVGRNDNFEMHDAFVAALPVERPRNVLDLACGFGKTTFSLKAAYPDAEVYGVDLSAPCLHLARRLATERGLEIHWRQADAEHTPYADNTFDLVTVTMALHEMPSASIEGTLREAHRLLKPDGVFCALEARLLHDPLRDLLGAYHSDVIVEPYMNAFRAADFRAYADSAGFVARADPWYAPAAVPGAEEDPTVWANAWTILVARKKAHS